MVIKARSIIEIVGGPKEHVDKAMNIVVDKLREDKQIKLLKEKVFEAKPLEDKRPLFSTFCEVEIEVMGKIYTRPRRTTTTNENGERDVISKKLFAEYYDFIQIVAAEKLGCHVPDPDPNWRAKLESAA